MRVTQKYWFAVLGACSACACAPLPTNHPDYKQSFIEHVLSKKESRTIAPTQTSSAASTQPSVADPIDSHLTTSNPTAEKSPITQPTSHPYSDQHNNTLANKLPPPMINEVTNNDTKTLDSIDSINASESTQPFSANEMTGIETDTTKPSLLVHNRNSKNNLGLTSESNALLFNINAPIINIVNLTGKPLIKLVRESTFNNEELNQLLTQKLEQSAIFQLNSSAPQKSSFATKLQSWGKQKSKTNTPAEADLSIEAKLIINQTEDSLAVGVTLNLQVFDSATGDSIANTRTYKVMTQNESSMANLITEAVADVSAEVSSHWSSR